MTFIVPPHWEQVTGMAPACDLLHQGLRDELFPKEQGEDFALEELGHQAVLELSEMMKRPLKVLASLGHQEVDMGVEINFLSERLDDGHHPWTKLSAGCGLVVDD
jgi:hypothetical protein